MNLAARCSTLAAALPAILTLLTARAGVLGIFLTLAFRCQGEVVNFTAAGGYTNGSLSGQTSWSGSTDWQVNTNGGGSATLPASAGNYDSVTYSLGVNALYSSGYSGSVNFSFTLGTNINSGFNQFANFGLQNSANRNNGPNLQIKAANSGFQWTIYNTVTYQITTAGLSGAGMGLSTNSTGTYQGTSAPLSLSFATALVGTTSAGSNVWTTVVTLTNLTTSASLGKLSQTWTNNTLWGVFDSLEFDGGNLPAICGTNGSLSVTQLVIQNVFSPPSVAIDRTTPAGTSQFYSSFSQVDNSLDYPWTGNNQTAVSNALKLTTQGIKFVANPIMAWGVSDPWPNPTVANPTNWYYLDLQMSNILKAGCTPILTLCEAPWWMKGQLQSDGSTHLIPDVNGEWAPYTYTNVITDFRGLKYTNYTSPDPYGSRIIDGQMTNWLLLVQRVAERYMVPPWNVRYFQVWNELKGYYNPILNHWDYSNTVGTVNGYNSQHGYTYLYNQTYQRLTNVAGGLGIAPSTLKIGGPYVVMASGASASSMSNPSGLTGPWGVMDQRSLDVLSYWLTNNVGAGFVCVDGGSGSGTSPFYACLIFSAVNNWIRQQPGGATLPIVWSEWYPDGGGQADSNLDNAVSTYAAIQSITSGAMLTLLWGGQYFSPLWSATSQSGGGQATPWYYTYRTLNQSFGNGINFYSASSTPNVAVLATLSNTLVVNLTTNTITVSIQATNNISPSSDSTNVTLGRYGVAILNAAVPWSMVQSLVLTNRLATVNFRGVAGYPYQVQRGTNVLFAGTLRFWTTNMPAGGYFTVTDDFSDLAVPPATAFYRLRYNPP
ncbi:MAG: hypothetical protein WCS94_06770 [Verrucomicrobiota bacterium]